MLSPSARFSALALLAIVAPAAIVAVLGYVSIRQWEVSSELLYREQARDMATMAAEKVEMTLRRAEDAFLDRLQVALRSGTPSERAVDALIADSPLIRRLYLVNPRGELLYPRAWREGDLAVFGPLVSGAALRRLERDGKRGVISNNLVCLALLTQRGGQPVVAAYLRDPDTMRREILETTLGTLESSTNIAVLDHEGRTVYSRAPIGDARRVLSVGFREALPDWRLAVYQTSGASPRQAVRRQVMFFTGALGVLVAVIVAGIVMTWRLMRRETEMARLKSDFVANVSHDLKTPLSVIRMFGETLEMGRVADEGRRQEYYRVITREGERLSRLIDNVLDFSRIEGGRQTYDMTPTAVAREPDRQRHQVLGRRSGIDDRRADRGGTARHRGQRPRPRDRARGAGEDLREVLSRGAERHARTPGQRGRAGAGAPHRRGAWRHDRGRERAG